ncbi:hypothetical protein CFC21_090513 [Triticum aestivum]|uniref:NB-ARC domain-containing protein n=3 Tax=Triticum TaxID=4564 RepID=A0A9R1BGQ3_TRITD|nr:hypothetical protein CFC21_090513 [Triticum aestivum]VAI64006.1 unnamed protein product [Triticum turgidum subsp. durum]
METAIGAAGWLLGKVLTKLSEDLVAAYVSSNELGLNFHDIKLKLLYTQGLLHASEGRDMSNNPGLYGLLGELSKKADEAEDMLDEIHYFMIQDQLDGTKEAAPELGDGVRGSALHVRHAARHTIGNWIPCFSCSRTQGGDSSVDVVTSDNDGGPVHKLSFDRVDMSNKIRSVIEELNSMCGPVSDLLKIPNHSNTATSTPITLKKPPTGSVSAQDKLYGREVIFEQTINELTGTKYLGETLSVMSFVGPGGMGKTTFTQHLYNEKRVEEHFIVRVWVCVSTGFDVTNLTRQTLRCIPAVEKEEYKCTVETASLDQLQKSIIERLKSKRFLIVLDDIWTCNNESDWNDLLVPFKQGEIKGSMVLVTTRFPSVVQMVKTTEPVELHGLKDDDFLKLLEACIFPENKPRHYEDQLIDVAKDIAKELKGSPLAANTVGRLLRKNISLEYWIEVLENDEWQNAKNTDDILPSLKISYDYLPFFLKKCFSYCALFPEDYKFYNLQTTSFWTAIGILDSSCQHDKNSSFQHDKNYLEELVDNGFLMKRVDIYNDQYYVMHDLLHELSRNVSSQECVNIRCSSFSTDNIPQSVRHLSITIEDICDESFEEEMGKLKGRIDIGNLRTLMIFGSPNARIANIFKDVFEEIKGLRILFIAINTIESLPKSFPNLIHLQYLKISSPDPLEEMTLPSTLSRFNHLKFLDLNLWRGSENLPKDFSRLINLRHFFSSKELHSNIPEVGKMKCLHELKEFNVKKEGVGFELKELGDLRELGGELCICNLEIVASKGEASAAKLKNKRNLKKLRLVWGAEHKTVDDDVLEGLEPHPDLRVLSITNAGVATCPRWLCDDLSTKRLESLHLEGISWVTHPAFEQLPHLTKLTLKSISGMRVLRLGFSTVTGRSFTHLKTLDLTDMPELVEWVGEPNSNLFSRLESISLEDCPSLCSFPFLEYSHLFTNLFSLDIRYCPKLSQFPPMPRTSTLSNMQLFNRSSSVVLHGKKKFRIKQYKGALAFHNLDEVEDMRIVGGPHISCSSLKKLNSLRSVHFEECDDMFFAEQDDAVVLHSVQNLVISDSRITGESFSNALKLLPALSQVILDKCKRLEFLPVEDGGLSGLRMLQSFRGLGCGNLFSRWHKGEVGGGGHAIKPFPTSLRELDISFELSIESMGLLSNLTSLTSLSLKVCKELTMDGFNPQITVNLKQLVLYANKFIAGDLLSEIARSKLMHAGSFQLEELEVDSISAVLTVPICSHLAATLHTLRFTIDKLATTFTEEQEQALLLLTSLKNLEFEWCKNLESFPRVLRGLSTLKRLRIYMCDKILCLPSKESLPASLETLVVWCDSPELTEQAKKLKGSEPWFSVKGYGL